MKELAIICVVLVCVFTYNEACTCARTHPQEQFCNSDFVVRARILRRTVTDSTEFENVFYTVLIRQNYKRWQYPSIHPVQRIYTASQSASCGASFVIGREYIISGSIQNNRLRTNLCSYNRETSSLNQFQRNALNFGYYRNNCSCNIRYCGFTDDPTCTVPERNECLIINNENCFSENDACIQYRRRCRWLSNQCA